MKYGSFKKKILILNRIINIIYKIRFILIAIFLASTTTVVTLKSVKGTNSSFVQRAANEIVYGEDYNFLPESIMNAAHVEYKEINETERSEEKPVYAGTYEARAYSYNGWDAKVIGETFKFTIKPKEIHLYSLQKELVYGEKLNYGSSSLINGDYFKNIQYDFAANYYTENPFDTKDTFNTTIDFNIETIKVLNNEEVDVTRNYSFVNDQTPITIKKRELSLQTDSLSLSYDGNPHTNTNFSFKNGTSLVEGDSIEVISSTEIKEVGKTENKLGIKILDSSKRNRTAFYDISFDNGSLTVEKRKITIETSSLSKVYDGKPFDESDFWIKVSPGSLLENHEIKVTYDHFYDFKPLIGDEEAKVNSVNFKIIDKDTLEDVTDRYYDYQVNPGDFNILKREITIKAVSDEKIYDSKSLDGSFVLVKGEIAETDKLDYGNDPSSITEVGSKTYSPSVIIIRNETGKDVTNCYQITIQEGELKIVKRNLILSSKSIDREYNGKALTIEDLSVDYDSKGDGLSENHKISFEFDNIGQYFIPNGTKNDFTYKIQDKEGNEIDINKYYNVTKEVGDLRISKKQFTLKTPVINNIYSGLEYKNDKYSQVGLVEETDRINFTKCEIKETNVGEYENSREYTIYNSVLDKDVTECYDIKENFGKFNINKNTITIKTEDYYGTYSGKELDTELVYSYKISNTVSPDIEVNISLKYQNVNVATFIDEPDLKNEATYTIIKDGVDVSDNFNIIEDFGDLHVEKAALRFSSHSLETTYDGMMHSNSDYDPPEGLQGDDIVSLISVPEFNHAGTHKNALQFNIYSDASETYNVTNCYEITRDYKDIVINKRNLTIDFANTAFSCTYDGYSHTFSKNQYKIIGDLASGDNLIIKEKSGTNIDFVEAGSYSFLSYYDISIFNDNGEDTTDDYDIRPINYTSIIEKQKLKIKIEDYFNTYDGDFHSASDSGYTIKEGTIAKNDNINIKSNSYKDAMDEESVFNTTINIENSSLHKDVTSSYDLEIEDGRVKIDKKTINVYLNNSSKEYDGNDTIKLNFTPDGFDLSTHNLSYPLVHTGNSNVCSNELISVDASKFAVIDSATNKDVTNNYSFNLIGEARYSIYSMYLKIYIDPKACTFIYDGNEHYITDKDLSYNGTLAKDDKITLVDYTPIVVKEVSDSGKDVVQIVASNIKIIGKDGSDNTSNYGIEILTKVDKYTIYAGELSLSSNPLPLTKTFDNKPFDKSLFKVSITNGYSLPLNEKIEPTFYNINVKDVGRYENSFSVQIIDTDTDNDVSSNYSISSLTFGELIINPLTFSISSLQNDSISYNGENYITDLIQEYEVLGSIRYVTIKSGYSDLLKIENIRIVAIFDETIPETKDAGEYSFSYKIHIYIDDIDVTDSDNFNFYSTNSYNVTFSIKKISLKFYNYGGEHSLGEVDETLELGGSVSDFENTGDTIYFGDEEFDEAKSDYLALDMSSPGTYTYEDLRYFFDTIRIVNKNGEDVTHNYEIDFSQIDAYEII